MDAISDENLLKEFIKRFEEYRLKAQKFDKLNEVFKSELFSIDDDGTFVHKEKNVDDINKKKKNKIRYKKNKTSKSKKIINLFLDFKPRKTGEIVEELKSKYSNDTFIPRNISSQISILKNEKILNGENFTNRLGKTNMYYGYSSWFDSNNKLLEEFRKKITIE